MSRTEGPEWPGGVSAALASVWEENVSDGSWWYVKDNALQMASSIHSAIEPFVSLSRDLIEGHYRFCNEFLWPVLHDLPEYASYSDEDRQHYDKFNETLSRVIGHSQTAQVDSTFFVQDYQLALMPQLLRRVGAGGTMIFWHVPWPQHVRSDHARILTPIAKAMLGADVVGFHTAEYGENFLSFVQAYLPDHRCDFENMTVSPTGDIVAAFVPSASQGRQKVYYPVRNAKANERSTEIVVAPLGIDFDHWSSLASNPKTAIWQPSLAKIPYVLSVDRVDYSKGVTARIRAIDAFLEKYPEWQGKLVFAQLCGRTRTGLPAYDSYWQECRKLARQLKEKWDTRHWQPLLWFERQFSPPELSLLYRDAAVMLVNPIRDGLNLTAKEYIACQGPKPGLLALSRGAGAWQELKEASMEVKPEDPLQMADTIYQALNMPAYEKASRMYYLSNKVEKNTLEKWWQRFSTPRPSKKAVGTAQFAQLREIS